MPVALPEPDTPPATGAADAAPDWAQVAAHAAAGDRRAFERLYRAHVDRVYALCARLAGDRALAEELTQDVFVRAWEKLALFKGESAFGTWLHRVAINVALNHLKSDGRHRRRTVDDADDVVAALPGRPLAPGDLMDLEHAVAKLPPGARTVLLMHDVNGYRYHEIAEMLGVSLGTVKSQLNRARRLMMEALER